MSQTEGLHTAWQLPTDVSVFQGACVSTVPSLTQGSDPLLARGFVAVSFLVGSFSGNSFLFGV